MDLKRLQRDLTSGIESKANATPAEEKRAKDNGFRSYEEMVLWAKQRANRSGGTVSKQNAKPSSESKPQQQNSRGGGLIGVLDSVSNALRGVNDKKKK